MSTAVDTSFAACYTLHMAANVIARKKCAATTREAMLCAARQCFLRESYENVGLRDVAREVGVDVALVCRYFGGKENLFREVLRGRDSTKLRIEGSAQQLPAYLATLLDPNDEGASREQAENLLILLRSASSPAAAKVVQEAVRKDALEPIAAVLDGDNADARAGLSLAILLGTAMLRAIMGMKPCDADRQFVERRLAAVFMAALSNDG